MKKKILVVEDQFVEANNLRMILERADYEVCSIARSVPAALKIVEEEKPDLVLLDIQLQGLLTGIDLAKVLRDRNIAFVYLSANSNREILEAAKATQPYGFLVKPFREKDVLIALDIAHYLHLYKPHAGLTTPPLLEPDQHALFLSSIQTPQLPNPSAVAVGLIGQSKALTNVLTMLQNVVTMETSMLILGESGTGKELIADYLHQASPRKRKPFIKVNCGALPANLFESELFGHEKGAFTGAVTLRIGKFEQANGGTLFLDEIGEMPLELQVKLLRVLQEKEIERIGGNAPRKIDVRIIAATNRNLEKEMAEGRFRLDLFYRLNVFPLTLSPLRERKEDIPLLTRHFIDQYSRKAGKKITGLTGKLAEAMMAYNWPGNVRELEHFIERSVLMATTDMLDELPTSTNTSSQTQPLTNEPIKTITEVERDHIVKVLTKVDGKIFGTGGAAELLGLPVSTLNSKIKKLGISIGKRFK